MTDPNSTVRPGSSAARIAAMVPAETPPPA
jgi:hypothetical protein